MTITLALLALLLAQAQPPPLPADAPAPTAPTSAGYADLADLALSSPVAAVATIDRATRLRGARATGVATGHSRFYVEADVTALLKAPGGLTPRVAYLVDVANDARGRPARLRDRRVLLLGRAAGPGELQLSSARSQIDWDTATEARLRAILTEAAAPGAPGAVTGIASAYHVPGTLAGEGETQIFVGTADGRPLTISVLRRPGETPRWSVSQGEIVDESAAAPAPGTLLWYRLACGLPPALPPGIAGEGAAQVAADYQIVTEALGPCGRTPAPAAPTAVSAS